jgi:hypothetical protein
VLRIDVDGHAARRNKQELRNDPCIRVTYRDGTKVYYKTVRILGPSRLVQAEADPSRPDVPYIWLETDAEVICD